VVGTGVGEKSGMTDVPDIMSVRDVRKALDLTQQTVYKLIEEGKLEGFRVGNQWRIHRESFNRLIGATAKNTPFRSIVEEAFTDAESEQRRVLELRYRDGLDRAAAAEELGITENRLHTLTVNVLLTLRPLLVASLTYTDVKDDEYALRVLTQIFLAQEEV